MACVLGCGDSFNAQSVHEAGEKCPVDVTWNNYNRQRRQIYHSPCTKPRNLKIEEVLTRSDQDHREPEPYLIDPIQQD